MQGTVELNRLNDLFNFVSHLKKQHDENPAARWQLRAFRKLRSFRGSRRSSSIRSLAPSIGVQRTLEAPARSHPAIGYVQAAREEMEVGTDAHAEWVAEVRARRARHESSE